MEYFKDEILLVIEDKNRYKKVLDLIRENVLNVKIHSAKDFHDAIDTYINNVKIDFVIIDSLTEKYDSFELLKKLKRIKSKVGILILSEDITKELSLKALNDGAYNLISLDKSLDAIIINIRSYFHGLQSDRLKVEIIQFLEEGKLTYVLPNSLKYIPVVSHHLTRDLAQVGLVNEDEIDNIKFGLQEILINSIEHGNLEITFEEKSKLLKKGYEISKIIDKFSSNKKYAERKVRIDFTLTKEKAEYIITDEGNGFEWKALSEKKSKKDLLLEHGRGISMAKKHFDEFFFNSKGNQVTMMIFKK